MYSIEFSGFLSIIVPSVSTIQHDHTYASPSPPSLDVNDTAYSLKQTSVLTGNTQNCPYSAEEFAQLEEMEVNRLCLTEEDRITLEHDTREQSGDDRWHDARRKRITGSKCGRILEQKNRTVALLSFCLYPKPFLFLPKAIEWGRQNEPVACKRYVQYMNSHGHPGLEASKCGFFVHPDKGWLGASPDATVHDPSSHAPHGLTEFKCPFSKANVDIEIACKDPLFYCTMVNDSLHLKHTHMYYHQVQLQLYTSSFTWCDFCVYTTKGVAVERIYLD